MRAEEYGTFQKRNSTSFFRLMQIGGLTLSGGGHTNICRIPFHFPFKTEHCEGGSGRQCEWGGWKGGSRNGKSSTTLKKELSANFRRACVNSSNRRLLCHRTIRGLSVRPEERGITELLPQGPTSRVCLGGGFTLARMHFMSLKPFALDLGRAVMAMKSSIYLVT